jgi:hypothetical protein
MQLCAITGRRQPQQIAASLFDRLVGEQHERIRDRKPDRLGGLEIDDQFVVGRKLDRQVGRALAFENPGGPI